MLLMAQVISYEERKFKAKGLDQFSKINEEKLRAYFLDGEYEQLAALDSLPKVSLSSSIPVLFYPGCGVDIFTPLIYLKKMFSSLKRAKLIFNDLDYTLGIHKTCLDEVGISFSEDRNSISFYFQDLLVELIFIQGDMFQLLQDLPEFDIYFERALRILREPYSEFERQVHAKLKSGGVLISDSGYAHLPLKSLAVPLSLSAYREMIIGVK